MTNILFISGIGLGVLYLLSKKKKVVVDEIVVDKVVDHDPDSIYPKNDHTLPKSVQKYVRLGPYPNKKACELSLKYPCEIYKNLYYPLCRDGYHPGPTGTTCSID